MTLPSSTFIRIARRAVRLVVASAFATAAVTAAAAPASAQPETCPATIVLAARGSGEPQTTPRSLASGAVTTDGWEGGMIARTLERLNLLDTLVWGLTGADYPAPLMTSGSGTSVSDATINGAAAAIRRVRTFEQSTGCRPSYMLIGYSQGAALMHLLEPAIAPSGRLVGAAYMGDPFLASFDPQLVGPNKTGRGMVYTASPVLASTAWRATGNVVEYCADHDPVCRYPGSMPEFHKEFGHHVAYFRPGNNQPEDNEFVARANSMLDEGRARKTVGANNASPIPWGWFTVG